MPATFMRVDGARELRRTLRQLGGPEIIALVKEEHKAIGRTVEEAAEAIAPRRTGRLATSMRSSGTNTMAVVRAGGARVPWAGPVHWGWPSRPNPARGWRGGPIEENPFIAIAAGRTEPQWLDHYNQAMGRLIERAERGAI